MKQYTKQEVIEMLQTVSMLSFEQGVEVGCGKETITRSSWTVEDWIEENLSESDNKDGNLSH